MIVRSPYPDVTIPDVPLHEFVTARFAQHADEVALVDAASGRSLTFAQIAGGMRALAAGLERRGFRRGDVFALWLPNVPEYSIAFLGITAAGGVVTTVNPLYTAAECAHQMSDTKARYLLTIGLFAEKALEVKAASAIEEVFVLGDAAPGTSPFASLLVPNGALPTPGTVPAADLAALPCSSGTTGKPKAVMLTHRNLVAQLCQAEEMFEDERDTSIAVLPFFHIYGMVLILLIGLRRCTKLVTMARFELEPFLEAIQKHRVTQASLVPPIILALAKHPAVDKYDLSSLRRIGSGAAPLAEATENACAQRIHCEISQGWGMTELTGAGISHGRLNALTVRHGSVGVPWPSMEVKIADVSTGAELRSGERGELCVRGPNVTRGYLNQPDATAATIDAEGWLHTGDVAYFDDDRYFYIVDRVKELIKYNAYQVAPAELESVLVSHPSVADVAVIPSPDEEAGEVPKAVVVLKAPATADELMAFVAERVAPYKKIRMIEFVDAIPRSAAGKILRRTLIERERAKSA